MTLSQIVIRDGTATLDPPGTPDQLAIAQLLAEHRRHFTNTGLIDAATELQALLPTGWRVEASFWDEHGTKLADKPEAFIVGHTRVRPHDPLNALVAYKWTPPPARPQVEAAAPPVKHVGKSGESYPINPVKLLGLTRYNDGSWTKEVTGIDTSRADGFSLVGDHFMRKGTDIYHVGHIYLDCGVGGSRKRHHKYYTLFRVDGPDNLTILAKSESRDWATQLWPALQAHLATIEQGAPT